jgi:hypothetical protein
LEAIKPFISLLSSFISSSVFEFLTEGHARERTTVQEGIEGKFFVAFFFGKPCPCS